MREDIIDDNDPLINSIVSDLLNRYSDNIIAIYGIGSYFEASLPPNWVKNDLDIIVFVKSLELIYAKTIDKADFWIKRIQYENEFIKSKEKNFPNFHFTKNFTNSLKYETGLYRPIPYL